MEKEKCTCNGEKDLEEEKECCSEENCDCDEECHCDEHCDGGDNCECSDDCDCDSEEGCNCNSECDCGDECDCTPEDNCGCGGSCHPEPKKGKKGLFKKKDNSDELKKEIEKLKNDALMAKADLINYRKRKDEEVSRMLKYSNEDLAKEILPIIDNFERAISMDNENLEDEVSKFLAGFKMIYCGLVGAMEKYGIKAIDGCNKPFDPTYHQAVMTEHREGVEPGMVIEVLQKGYLLKDKVIRPAMVRVSE